MDINNNDKQKSINNALNAYNITNENIFCDESYKNKKWIWQHHNYPNFIYNKIDTVEIIKEIEKNHTILSNIVNKINKNDFLQAQISSLENEIINSSLIEGEILDRASVRSSIKKKLDEKFDGLADTSSTRQTDNLISILIDANLNKAPMSIERLHGWHNAIFESGYSGLFKIKVAQFRDSQIQVVSGAMTREKIHYEAVPPKHIEKDMKLFLDFINNSQENAYVKSAIAHLWFVVIHPYDDGNGRITRALADYCLPNNNIKLYSISSIIQSNKKAYYEKLEQTTKLVSNPNCDFMAWIKWHLEMTNRAIKDSINLIKNIAFKTDFWDKFRTCNLNKIQQKVLNKVLDVGVSNFNGGIDIVKFASIAKISKDMAKKEIDELVKFGCLKIKENGKSYLLSNDSNTDLKHSYIDNENEDSKLKIQYK